MATLEGDLLAKWRKSEGLTQERLGERCPMPKSVKTINGYEKGHSSMSISTLLNVIRGLRISGISDAQRLERFFAGPEADLVQEDARRLAAEAAALARRLGRKREE